MGQSMSGQRELGGDELRQQIADEARRLRSLAAMVRARSVAPNLSQYVRSGRGPAYQRDHAAWMKAASAAHALDDAAMRLEQAVAASGR